MFYWISSCRSNNSRKICNFSLLILVSLKFMVSLKILVSIYSLNDKTLFPAYFIGKPKWSGQVVIGRERYLNSRVNSRKMWPLTFGFWIRYFEPTIALVKWEFSFMLRNYWYFVNYFNQKKMNEQMDFFRINKQYFMVILNKWIFLEQSYVATKCLAIHPIAIELTKIC